MTHPYKTREGGATVTIFVPYDCRNHCPFCVNKQEYAHAEGFSVEAILKSIAVMDEITPRCDFVFTGGEPFANLKALQRMLDAIPTTHKVYINTTFPVQFRYDYTETTPENLYQEEGDKILADLKKRFTYKGLDGCRMRNGYHFDYKGLHMTYHKTLPYSTIVETGDDGVTYDILYDILIKQTGEIHSDWTGVKLDVDAYRKVVYEPYDLCVREGTIDF